MTIILLQWTKFHFRIKLINDHPPAKSLQSPVASFSFVSSLCRLCNKVKNKTPTTSLCMCAQLCLTFCDHMDCSLLGFSVHGTSQARILEWVTVSSSRRPSPPRDWTHISCISYVGGQILHHCGAGEAHGLANPLQILLWVRRQQQITGLTKIQAIVLRPKLLKMIFLVKIKLDYTETSPLPIPSIKSFPLKLSRATCLLGNRFTIHNPG